MNIAESLKSVTLDKLDNSLWPVGAVTDELASEAGRLRKRGIAKPFVLFDVAKFLPYWANSARDPAAEIDREPDKPKGEFAAVKMQKISLQQWTVAYDRLCVGSLCCVVALA